MREFSKHKIFLPKQNKNHYNEIFLKPWPYNKTKIEKERIEIREVTYRFHKRGSIEIYIACSENPFQLETEDDVNNIFVFLGQVKDRLACILNDPRERIVPQLDTWILKYCDFNKDGELKDNLGQLMNLNIQIKYAGQAFRLYVKNMQDKFVLREEKVTNVNQPITTFMNDSVLSPLHLIDTKLNEFVSNIETKFNELINRIEKKI